MHLTPQRIIEARNAKGITQKQLAEEIGKTSQTIRNYETGLRTPDGETLEKVADALNVKPSFFILDRPFSVGQPETIFFRAVKAARSQRSQKKYSVRASWAAEIRNWLSLRMTLPKVHLPTENWKGFREDDEVESLAAITREKWGLGKGPIPSVTTLLESKGGILCYRMSWDDMRTSAISCWLDNKPSIFLNRRPTSPSRLRMNAAHELGHLVMHRGITTGELADGMNDIEHEANLFAGALLLPAESFAADIDCRVSLSFLLSLKSRWLVSIQAMIMRCAQLDLIGESRKTELFRQISRNGWRFEEPGEEHIPIETEPVIERGFRMVQNQSPSGLMELIHAQHNPDFARDLLGLTELSGQGKIIEFNPELKPEITVIP